MKALFLFENTRGVIRAETLCRQKALPVEVITVPREMSSECGMCLSLAQKHVADAQNLLNEAGISCQCHNPDRIRVDFDLLSTVEYGGCSAKIPADLLKDALQGLVPPSDSRLLVGVDTCDDAGVFRLSDDQALIVTTDFFPPICSDPYEFGQIAAANALSDVFAMGGEVLTALNLVMFPAEGIPFEVLKAILAGGQDKVHEAGGMTVGGHTIADSPPKYGLAVTGIVHPDQLMTNALGKAGEALVLTKPLGTGTLVAGQRLGEARKEDYRNAVETMRQLNRSSAALARKHGVRCATDITGFGLLGHALHIAQASNVTVELESQALPVLPGAHSLLQMGCIPGAAFRNQIYVQDATYVVEDVPYEVKMLALDPQTSGGLLLSLQESSCDALLRDLRANGHKQAVRVGTLKKRGQKLLQLV